MINYNSRNRVEQLIKLNEFIHHGTQLYEYHMEHIQLVSQYALIINDRLGADIDPSKLTYIALAHDLFKDRPLKINNKRVQVVGSLTEQHLGWHNHSSASHELIHERVNNKNRTSMEWNGLEIPVSLNWYVRSNLETLERFNLSEYFNTDIQLHPLASGLFLIKQLEVEDLDILYPIFFHSCPIIPVYQTLSHEVRTMVDIIMLADKLSSNWLKINSREVPVRCDLDLIVFGPDGGEFNYTMGLYIARLISQGSTTREWTVMATEHYHKRLMDMNPLVPKKFSFKKLGGAKTWAKRKSQLLRTQ